MVILCECKYRSVPSKHPLPGKHPCTVFQGATVAASIQTYGILIPGKRPCRPKSQVNMFKCPWALTRDTTVIYTVMNKKIIIMLVHLPTTPPPQSITSKILYFLKDAWLNRSLCYSSVICDNVMNHDCSLYGITRKNGIFWRSKHWQCGFIPMCTC